MPSRGLKIGDDVFDGRGQLKAVPFRLFSLDGTEVGRFYIGVLE